MFDCGLPRTPALPQTPEVFRGDRLFDNLVYLFRFRMICDMNKEGGLLARNVARGLRLPSNVSSMFDTKYVSVPVKA